MNEPFDFNKFDALLGEHEAIPGLLFTAAGTEPTSVIVRVFDDAGDALRITIEDGGQINHQLVLNQEKLRERVDDPTAMDD